jgi:hypothetical protein
LSTAAAKLQRLFNFHLLFYYMAEAPSSTFNPRRLLQLQSSSPTSSLITFNFNSRCQLHPSSLTSTLVAFNFNSSPFNFQTPSLFYFLPFFLMPVVCLMQLLPDELVTQIIIHSFKDEPAFQSQKGRSL